MLHDYDSLFLLFIDTPPTEIYTLSLHDALPICEGEADGRDHERREHGDTGRLRPGGGRVDHPDQLRGHQNRKSTRLNSSHGYISYAVFCLKKKKKNQIQKFYNIKAHDNLEAAQL